MRPFAPDDLGMSGNGLKTFVWQAVMILGMVGLLKRGADKFYKQPSRDRDYSRYFD